MRYTTKPDKAKVIRTYAALKAVVEAWFQGHYQLLAIIGSPGLGKSYEFELRYDDPEYQPYFHIIKGWAAPLSVYMEMFLHRDKFLLFDDTESLWGRPGGKVIVRSATELKEIKTMQWTSTAGNLAKLAEDNGYELEEVKTFKTSSKIAVLGNEFPDNDIAYAAVLDRGHLFFFDPSNEELHKNATWFWDQEIFDYIGARLQLIERLSFRLYIKTYEEKCARRNWKEFVDDHCLDTNYLLVQEIEQKKKKNKKYDFAREWELKSRKHPGKSDEPLGRATYYNYRTALEEANQLNPIAPLKIKCKGKTPKPMSIRERIKKSQAELALRRIAAQEAKEQEESEEGWDE